MADLTVAAAADQLGVPYDVVRQWVTLDVLPPGRRADTVTAAGVTALAAVRDRYATARLEATVATLKGGVGKTTLVWHLATLLGSAGRRVLVIDTDPQSQSALDWANIAVARGYTVPFQVLPWATHDLPARVSAYRRDPGYDDLLIDAGGLDVTLFERALSVTAQLILPIPPNPIDVRRLPATVDTARRVQEATGRRIYPTVLLTRVDRRVDADNARTFLASSNLPVLKAQVRNLAQYPRAFGTVPTAAQCADYHAPLHELRQLAANIPPEESR